MFSTDWPGCHSQSQSPFFSRLPPELRDRVYHFALVAPTPPSYPDPEEGDVIQPFSELAAPRFTCHRMDAEARKIVFHDNVHVLNWLEYRRSFSRPGDYLNRMYNIEQDLVQQMEKIAIYTTPGDLEMLLDELALHLGDRWSPVNRLKELRIILDIPYHTDPSEVRSRIRQEQEVCKLAYGVEDVDTVIVQNLLHRTQSRFKGGEREWHWNILAWEDDDERLNDDR